MKHLLDDFDEFKKDFILRKSKSSIDFENYNRFKNTSYEDIVEEITNIFVDAMDKGYTLYFFPDTNQHLIFKFRIQYLNTEILTGRLFHSTCVNNEFLTLQEYFGFNNINYNDRNRIKIIDKYSDVPDRFIRSLEVTISEKLPLEIQVTYSL